MRHLIIACIVLASAGMMHAGELLKDTFDSSPSDGAFVSGIEYADDEDGGKCLKASGQILYPQGKFFSLREGTVDFRVRFNTQAAITNNATLTMFRAVAPGAKDAFANSIVFMRGWGSGIFLLIGDKDGKRTTISFQKMMTVWKPGEWHRIAFTWKFDNPGKSEVALYIDAVLIDKKTGLTIEMDDTFWKTATEMPKGKTYQDHVDRSFWFGGCWGSKDADVLLDDLAVFDAARQYSDAIGSRATQRQQ